MKTLRYKQKTTWRFFEKILNRYENIMFFETSFSFTTPMNFITQLCWLGAWISIYAKDFAPLVVGLRCLSSEQLIDFCLIEYVTGAHPRICFVWGAQLRLLDRKQHVFLVQGYQLDICVPNTVFNLSQKRASSNRIIFNKFIIFIYLPYKEIQHH